MRRPEKNGRQAEQAHKNIKKQAKIEPLRPQTKEDKLHNEMTNLLLECPYPVLRIHKNGIVLYANKAGEELLNAKDSGIGRPAPEEWRQPIKETFASGRERAYETEHNKRIFGFQAVPIVDSDYVNFYGMDITQHKRAEQERLSHLRFLEGMDHINRAIQGTNDIEQMMSNVLDVVLSIFNCDRVSLVYPCDPDAPSWSAPMERTRPEWPGALTLGLVVPMDTEVARIFRVSRAADGPVEFGPGYKEQLPTEIAAQFNIQSQMTMALYPKIGKPWNFVMHQCSHPRLWTQEEKRLSGEISRRLEDALTSLLIYRNLKERENKYRELADSITDVFFAMDTDLKYTYWNKASENLTGIKAEDAIGKTIFDIFPDTKETRKTAAVYQDVLKKKQPKNFENEYRLEDKHYFFEISVYPNEDGISVFAKDITEQKQTQKELQRLAGFWESIVQNANVYMDVLDENRNVLIWNKAAEKISGYSADEVVGHDKIWQWQYPDPNYRNNIIKTATKVIEGKKELKEFESVIVTKSGEERVISWYSRNLTDENGKSIGSVATGIDITEHKKAEQELLKDRKKLKQLASQLALTEERQRRRIATELHDRFSQLLALSKIKLDTLRASAPRQLKPELAGVSNTLQHLIDQARTLVFDISSPILYDLGLEAAVAEWLNEEVHNKHGIAVEFQDDGRPKPLDDDVRTLLFRNVRELLMNAIKYAHADKVNVRIRRIDDSIQVIVEDNGVGFDPAEVKAMSAKEAKFGLFSIKESLEQLGGSFEIESKPGAGCKAIITAPLKGQPHNKEC